MELRVWIPESVSAWRYCLRRPRSFLIGAYGFTQWLEEYLARMALAGELRREKVAHAATREKLAATSKELSTVKRGKVAA